MNDVIYKLVEKFNIVSCESGRILELHCYKVIKKDGGIRYVSCLDDGKAMEQVNDDEYLLPLTQEKFTRTK